MVSCTIPVQSVVEAPGLKLNCRLLVHKLSSSLVITITSSSLHKILLRVMALKLSDEDKCAHLPLVVVVVVVVEAAVVVVVLVVVVVVVVVVVILLTTYNSQHIQ